MGQVQNVKNKSLEVIVYGEASGKKLHHGFWKSEEHKNLLLYLQSLPLPIASSCDGAGICEKCVFNHSLLSCQIDTHWLEKNNEINPPLIIKISYL